VIGVGRLKPGETLLVHGGGSGIGTFAIQFAKALGVTTITTARKAKHDRLRELGADATIDYTTEDFTEHKADMILDIMGAAYLAKNLATLNPNGRLLVIGMQGGRTAELDLGALMTKRALVAATALRSRPANEKAKIIQGVREEVWPLLESRAVKPVIYTKLPMPQAAEAHRLVESNQHFGKVLLVNPDSAA
jgi:NADPH:quinone reductase-like Zn-dependent oxidoreductase